MRQQRREQDGRVVGWPVLSWRMYVALGDLVHVLASRERELTQPQRQMLARAIEARSDTAIRLGWSR